MNKTKLILLSCTLALALCFAPIGAGEEDVYPELALWDLLLSIVENPDPIPMVHWAKLDIDPALPEARTPGDRADGRPDINFDRMSETPLVTWAFDTGYDYEIAFNRWLGDDWDPKIEFLSSGSEDDLDPRIFVDGHNKISLIWWQDVGPGRVQLIRHDPMRGWTPPVQVAAGRRPSVAMHTGDTVIAFERERADGMTEIVVGRSGRGAPYIFEVVWTAPTAARLDPVVHSRSGWLWIDWKDGDRINFRTHQGGSWQAMKSVPWLDRSWIGEATTRHRVELEVVR